METINDVFKNFGWMQVNQENSSNKQIFIKNKKSRLDEFIIQQTQDENTFMITLPLMNSDFLYTNTISGIDNVKTYLEMHLQERQIPNTKKR
jgi:hypothetical protein